MIWLQGSFIAYHCVGKLKFLLSHLSLKYKQICGHGKDCELIKNSSKPFVKDLICLPLKEMNVILGGLCWCKLLAYTH